MDVQAGHPAGTVNPRLTARSSTKVDQLGSAERESAVVF